MKIIGQVREHEREVFTAHEGIDTQGLCGRAYSQRAGEEEMQYDNEGD